VKIFTLAFFRLPSVFSVVVWNLLFILLSRKWRSRFRDHWEKDVRAAGFCVKFQRICDFRRIIFRPNQANKKVAAW
jgi:hypothetical protein